jgi:NAD(P)-dependent dehydrogenase (short-subunit alcohol dehydrogenase family)
MRVMIVGGTGTIGSAIAAALAGRHEVIRVGASSGDLVVDLADKASIASLYDAAGPVDAVVSAAGVARFGPLENLEDDDFSFSIRNKLMGNVNLVRLGLGRVREGGSFTLTTGNLSQDPQPQSAIASMVGAGLESFARAAALELEGRYRVNVVSPGWVRETMEALGMDPTPGMPAAELAAHYVQAVDGAMTGRILEPWSA